MSELRYDNLLQRRQGLTRDVPPGDNADLLWVANSATLICGDRDAVLVDTFMTIEENKRLVEWIRSHGRNLTHIFLTHGHGDHVYGIGQVLEAFPDAKAVATAGTVAEASREAGDEYRVGFFGRLFPGQIPQQLRIPTEIPGATIALEDHELRVIDTGHTDTMATSVLWCPSLRLIVAGDVVYNRTHMYLGESTTASREEWIATLTKLKDLDPLHVVAGHQQPDGTDDPTDIDESIQYLTDFNNAETRYTKPSCRSIPDALTPDHSGALPKSQKARSEHLSAIGRTIHTYPVTWEQQQPVTPFAQQATCVRDGRAADEPRFVEALRPVS